MPTDSSSSHHIGLVIKRLRKVKGLTLKELADIINTSASYLSELERGEKSPGSKIICSLKRNLKDLDLNIAYLIEGENDPRLDKIIMDNNNK